MRFLIKMKLVVLMTIWTLVCLAGYAIIALGEAVLEISVDAAGAVAGQNGSVSGLIDLAGDIIQWGVGLIWLSGVVALWFIKRLLTSRETRSATFNAAAKAAGKAAPHVVARHPLGRVVNMAHGPAGRMLGNMLSRKGRKPGQLK